eukprot:CAMPEP_0194344438 /NCGR_PEP_ID=MMETSP0171-20130528/101462_1 /TAXON_ID=218684 /ORGANISM="Corethron pennatum, Strain L29A3" /LENGTH=167 /DNA_ID=CAMNT_0039111103 /DNA_START=182 /DNA_END=686 /DNA_ORIENTATION=-
MHHMSCIKTSRRAPSNSVFVSMSKAVPSVKRALYAGKMGQFGEPPGGASPIRRKHVRMCTRVKEGHSMGPDAPPSPQVAASVLRVMGEACSAAAPCSEAAPRRTGAGLNYRNISGGGTCSETIPVETRNGGRVVCATLVRRIHTRYQQSCVGGGNGRKWRRAPVTVL